VVTFLEGSTIAEAFEHLEPGMIPYSITMLKITSGEGVIIWLKRGEILSREQAHIQVERVEVRREQDV